MKFCEILWNFVKFCWILYNFISFESVLTIVLLSAEPIVVVKNSGLVTEQHKLLGKVVYNVLSFYTGITRYLANEFYKMSSCFIFQKTFSLIFWLDKFSWGETNMLKRVPGNNVASPRPLFQLKNTELAGPATQGSKPFFFVADKKAK